MLANSFNRRPGNGRLLHNRWVYAIALGAWVFISFIVAQLIVIAVILVLRSLGIEFVGVNPAVLNTVVAAVVYALSISIVIGVPWRLRKARTNREDLGLTRLPEWFDILLAPAGFIVYLLLSSVFAYLALKVFPGFNSGQSQDVGFSNISGQYEILLAFLTLVIVAPLAEETLMRGYLYGKLRQRIPIWAAAVLTSIVFGLLHGQWNVGLDVFALSLVLCSLREVTGSIWAGVLLHMMKNGLAFYLLFINPAFLHTIGG